MKDTHGLQHGAESTTAYTGSLTHSLSVCLSLSLHHFPGKPGLAGFIEAKDDGSGGDSWSYKLCKVPVRSSPPTNYNTQLFTSGIPFLSPNQHCQSTEGKTGSLYLSDKIVLRLSFCSKLGLKLDFDPKDKAVLAFVNKSSIKLIVPLKAEHKIKFIFKAKLI